MKIAWLVWDYEESQYPELHHKEPEYFYKKIRIVYAEIE